VEYRVKIASRSKVNVDRPVMVGVLLKARITELGLWTGYLYSPVDDVGVSEEQVSAFGRKGLRNHCGFIS